MLLLDSKHCKRKEKMKYKGKIRYLFIVKKQSVSLKPFSNSCIFFSFSSHSRAGVYKGQADFLERRF